MDDPHHMDDLQGRAITKFYSHCDDNDDAGSFHSIPQGMAVLVQVLALELAMLEQGMAVCTKYLPTTVQPNHLLYYIFQDCKLIKPRCTPDHL